MRDKNNTKTSFITKVANRVDNFIGFFSPEAAARRKYFRFISQNMFGSYRGASRDSMRKAWGPGGGSADQDLLPDLKILRERSRDLVRNDAVASGAITTVVTNIIGTGIKPQSRIDKEILNINEEYASVLQKKLERIWERWIPHADAGNRMNFYEIEELSERQRFVNGEAIIVPLWVKDDTRPYNFAVQIIESDRLDTPTELRSDKTVRSGIEIGDRGEPVVYYIRKTHPGNVSIGQKGGNGLDNYIKYPASNKTGRKNIFHLYHVLRAGQARGEPFFAPVINLFKDRFEYMEAELVANRIAACFALFIKRSNAFDTGISRTKTTEIDGKRIEEMTPAMVEYLEPGEEVQTFNPNRPGVTFTPFMERILRDISSGLNVPYEILAKDFSKSNYSNTRAALLEARRYFMMQQRFVSDKLGQPIFEMLIEEAYLKGELPILDFYYNRAAYVRTRWIAPGWQWVDPLKEVKAAVEAVDNNISTLAEVAAAHGCDWEDDLEQRAREEKKIKDLEKKHDIKLRPEKKDKDKDDKDEEGKGND